MTDHNNQDLQNESSRKRLREISHHFKLPIPIQKQRKGLGLEGSQSQHRSKLDHVQKIIQKKNQ